MEFRHILIERHRQEVDFALVGLKGLSTLTPQETACSRARTVSSAPREEREFRRHILIERLRNTQDRPVNSTVYLTRSETKVTNGPTRATIHPYRSSSCRNKLQQQVAPRRQVLGSLPFHAMCFFGPSPWCNTHAGKRVPFGNEWQLGLFLFGCRVEMWIKCTRASRAVFCFAALRLFRAVCMKACMHVCMYA